MGIGPTSRKWRPRPPPLLYFAVTGRGLDRIARFGAYANGLAIVPQPQRLMRPSAIKRRHVKSIRSDLFSVAKSVFEISAAVTPGWCAMRVSIASAIVTKSPRLSFRHDTGVSPILGSRRGDSSPRWALPASVPERSLVIVVDLTVTPPVAPIPIARSAVLGGASEPIFRKTGPISAEPCVIF
jgi:hypothetical protein